MSNPGVPRDSTTLLVNWERPTCDRGVLSGYELCYVESSVGDCVNNGITVNISDPDQLSYTIKDLLINTNYTDEDGKLYSLPVVMYTVYCKLFEVEKFRSCRTKL